MILLKILLLPFSFIYLLITKFRNHLFNIGYSHSFNFETYVINVGNLRVGGTGKTPHVEYLIGLLKGKYKLATLSRGYGRKTKGFILADQNASAKSIGDEPFQFYTKFSNEISIAVGEERALAIPTILFERPDTKVIIMDDAYQHRSVVPDLNILLSDYNHPFYKDIVLPSGRLRESRSGAKRADIIVVTKCPPDLNVQHRIDIKEKISKYASVGTPVFFTGIRYKIPQALFSMNASTSLDRILLVSGIANSMSLEKEVKGKFKLEKSLNFNDHHDYDEKSIKTILKHFEEIKGNDKAILTTEKDMVKWTSEPIKSMLKDLPVFYLPIEIYFLDGKENFDSLILEKVKIKF